MQAKFEDYIWNFSMFELNIFLATNSKKGLGVEILAALSRYNVAK